jgi:hypothetical protein
MAAPLAYKTFMLIHYSVHYTYYAEVLCENKDNPMLECNGKCAISKELKKAEEGKRNAEEQIPVWNKLEVSQFIASDKTECSFGYLKNDSISTSYYLEPSSEAVLNHLDHPPIAA